jgi:hypothetical protein
MGSWVGDTGNVGWWWCTYIGLSFFFFWLDWQVPRTYCIVVVVMVVVVVVVLMVVGVFDSLGDVVVFSRLDLIYVWSTSYFILF